MSTITIPEPQARPEVVPLSTADVARIQALYAQGLCLQAYRAGEELGPLAAWTGTAARLIGGRLAMNLGAARLGRWHHVRAWRADPDDPEACYYYARAVMERRGPLAAWRFMRRQGDLPGVPAKIQADWLAFHACVAGRFRDFERAEDWLARAETLDADSPWICVERSGLLELEDRYEEALAAARRALELRPWFRPAVQAAAHILQLLDRDSAAMELLADAAQRIENGLVVLQLAFLQTELGLHAEARQNLERYVELSPLLENGMQPWLHARRSDAAYHCGDFEQALAEARLAKNPFHDKIAEHLAAHPDGRRVLLPVGFVRQHHQTCAPATLSALSRFWSMPAAHLEVAEAICYDGTPDHSERYWAEQHGWCVREFAVTWEAAVALLDRGLPFTLTTVEPGSAHLQAVIGYDGRRGTLLVRDPYERHSGEFLAGPMFERYRSTGPRGMTLVPLAEQHQLEGIELPDARLYDLNYRVQRALQEHDRDRAYQAYAELQSAAPDHRLTLHARRSLAGYDADPTEILACVERLLTHFPDDVNLQLSRLACLRDLARREPRVAMLEEICARPGSDPIFWQQLAQELSADAREHARALTLLRRADRYRPLTSGIFLARANLLWEQRRFEEALELYRLASCLDDKDERLARVYFNAARHLRRTDEALRLLRDRFRRFGRRSSRPGRTLSTAHDQLDAAAESRAVLDEALALRPDDGELLLFAAETGANHGDFDRAAALLESARGHAPATAWLRTAAVLASNRGDLPQSLALWRQVVEAEPLALDANRSVALLLAETVGRAEALDHLRQACARFPHNFALHQLWIGWLREDGPEATEPVIRQLLEIHPVDAWARRELALTLGIQGRFDEAFAELEIARCLEPSSPSYYTSLAAVCFRSGRREEGMTACREAIRLSADSEPAIIDLMSACDTLAERREALAFIIAELQRQVIYGDGLLTFRAQARYTLEPGELLVTLRQALAARPDLWHAWSAVIGQLTEMAETLRANDSAAATALLEEALDLARQATARFPLLPRLWLDLAAVCRARRDQAGETEALQHALQLTPTWGTALRQLAAVHERDGQLAEARQVLEQAVARAPLDVANWGCLADALWRLGEREPAVDKVQQALRLEPGYEWAWRALADWAAVLGRPQLPVELARDLTVRRAGEARSWLLLARNLHQPEDLDERLTALEQAVARNPRLVDAYDLRADLLTRAGRFDEARAACRADVWQGRPPLLLRGRAAWVEAEADNRPEAIALMKAAVAEDPAYFWGWENLASWYRADKADADYLEAARTLVRLDPQNAVPHGFLGEALLRADDAAGAGAAWTRALELDPEYRYAALNLFDLQLNDEALEAAAATLDLLRRHHRDEFVVFRVVELAVRRGDGAAAAAGLAELCEGVQREPRLLDEAVTLMVNAGLAQQAETALEAALTRPGVDPCVGRLWVERCVARNGWNCRRRFDQLLDNPSGTEALIAYARALGKAQRRWTLRRFVRRYRDHLRADVHRWGQTAFAFGSASDYRGAIAWQSDWAERPDAEPWMLINHALHLRQLGRANEAHRVSLRALEQPADYTSSFHAIWVVVDDALAGATAAAAERLTTIDTDRLDGLHDFVRELAEGLLHVQQAAPDKRQQAFVEARRRYAEAVRAQESIDQFDGLPKTYRRCVRRLARDAGGWTAALWAAWRCVQPLLPRYEKS